MAVANGIYFQKIKSKRPFIKSQKLNCGKEIIFSDMNPTCIYKVTQRICFHLIKLEKIIYKHFWLHVTLKILSILMKYSIYLYVNSYFHNGFSDILCISDFFTLLLGNYWFGLNLISNGQFCSIKFTVGKIRLAINSTIFMSLSKKKKKTKDYYWAHMTNVGICDITEKKSQYLHLQKFTNKIYFLISFVVRRKQIVSLNTCWKFLKQYLSPILYICMYI